MAHGASSACLLLLQVYLPMSYIYGIRGTCKETPLTAAIRCAQLCVFGCISSAAYGNSLQQQ